MKVKRKEGSLVVEMDLGEADTFKEFLDDEHLLQLSRRHEEDAEVISRIKKRLHDLRAGDDAVISLELTSREIEWVLSRLGEWALLRQSEGDKMKTLNDLLDKAAL